MAATKSHTFSAAYFFLLFVIFQNISSISSAVATPTLPSLFRAPPVITLPTIPSSSQNVISPQSGPGVNSNSDSESNFYKNPIIPWLDPYGISVHLHTDGFYYAVSVHPPDHQETQRSESIFVMRSRKLTDWTTAHAQTKRDVLQLKGTSLDPDSDRWIFGPRLQFIDGAWYIYFSMEVNETISTSRYFVIEGKGENPMDAQFGPPIELLPPGDTDYTLFKGAVLNSGPGELYFVFSGHAGRSGYENTARISHELFIATMSSPTQISGAPVILRSTGGDPQILRKPGLDYRESIFIVYNAKLKAGHNPDACLGAIRLDYGFHPLVQENWKPVQDGGCLFGKNEKEGVYAVAGASFTTSPDGTETWVIYKATSSPTGDMKQRNIRAEKIGWDTNSGEPVFPRPGGLSIRYKNPREIGTTATLPYPVSSPFSNSFGWRSGPVISLPTVPGSLVVETTRAPAKTIIAGGLGDKQPPNQQVNTLVQKLAPEIHAAACRKLGVSLERKDCKNEDVSLTVVEYKQQVVAGTNYFVKLSREVNQVKEFWHARIFHQAWTKTLQLTSVAGPKNENDEINFF